MLSFELERGDIPSIEISVIDINSNDYPLLLKELSDPPHILYVKHAKGKFDSSIFNLGLSVVGSRKMTEYGKRVTHNFVSDYASNGICIISGFMYGIDALAHKTALSVGGKTVAVMPCGHDYICPDFQTDLYYEILKGDGLIITEYEHDVPPKTWTFPRRNRIIAALGLATFIVEAGESSGSLITAQYAKKLGRKIFTVPGDIFDPSIKGNWQLINGGAEVVISGCEISDYCRDRAQDIWLSDASLSDKGLKDGPLFPAKNDMDEEIMDSDSDAYVITALMDKYLSIDELHTLLKMPVSKIMSSITSLTLRNLIHEKNGKYYVN